jgi:hypothetical protein
MTSLEGYGESWQNKQIGEFGAKTCFFLYFSNVLLDRGLLVFLTNWPRVWAREGLEADGSGNCPRPMIESHGV